MRKKRPQNRKAKRVLEETCLLVCEFIAEIEKKTVWRCVINKKKLPVCPKIPAQNGKFLMDDIQDSKWFHFSDFKL